MFKCHSHRAVRVIPFDTQEYVYENTVQYLCDPICVNLCSILVADYGWLALFVSPGLLEMHPAARCQLGSFALKHLGCVKNVHRRIYYVIIFIFNPLCSFCGNRSYAGIFGFDKGYSWLIILYQCPLRWCYRPQKFWIWIGLRWHRVPLFWWCHVDQVPGQEGTWRCFFSRKGEQRSMIYKCRSEHLNWIVGNMSFLCIPELISFWVVGLGVCWESRREHAGCGGLCQTERGG